MTDVLAGEKLYLEPHQLGPDAVKELTKTLSSLGAEAVSTPEEATTILINPLHPSYPASYTSTTPPRISYNWLAACAASRTRVDPATVPSPVLINHWRAGWYMHTPITLYVSVNLRRHYAHEDPQEIQANVQASVARLGAIVVEKRSRADVLIVDRKSAFFTDKIVSEVRKYGRELQRFAEREWAEACVREGRMLPLENLEGGLMPGPPDGEGGAGPSGSAMMEERVEDERREEGGEGVPKAPKITQTSHPTLPAPTPAPPSPVPPATETPANHVPGAPPVTDDEGPAPAAVGADVGLELGAADAAPDARKENSPAPPPAAANPPNAPGTSASATATAKEPTSAQEAQPIISTARPSSGSPGPDLPSREERKRKRAEAEAEERRRQREDSFAEDDEAEAVFFKKGPGRPTGKPRNDYSPEDDEFLCRYLAKYHPSGSWGSRKTYSTMTERVAQYPIAGRHPGQSWHERFKKNRIAFERRVQRLMQQGLDGNLKTVTERLTAAERARPRAAAFWQATPASGNVTANGKRKEQENDKAIEPAGKRKLVDLSDDEDDAPRKKDPPRVAACRLGRQRGFPSRTGAGSAPGLVNSSQPAHLPPSQAAPSPARAPPAEVPPPAPKTRERLFHHRPGSVSPEPAPEPAPSEIIVVDNDDDDGATTTGQQPAQATDLSQLEQPTEDPPAEGVRVGVNVLDATPVEAEVPDKPLVPDTPAPVTDTEPPSGLPADAAQPSLPTQTSTALATEAAAPQPGTSPDGAEAAPPAVAAPSESEPEQSEPEAPAALDIPAASTPAASTPAASPSPPPEVPGAPAPAVTPSPPPEAPIVAAAVPDRASVANQVHQLRASVSPSKRRQSNITTVAIPTTRAASQESPNTHSPTHRRKSSISSSTRKRRRVPDTIAASATVPPAPVPILEESPAQSPAPAPASRIQVPLGPEERQRQFERGRTIVQDAAQQYQSYIRRWFDVYGVGPAEIQSAVETVRKRTNLSASPLVFAEVEAVLAERYG